MVFPQSFGLSLVESKPFDEIFFGLVKKFDFHSTNFLILFSAAAKRDLPGQPSFLPVLTRHSYFS
jgi:hypothetical protein